MDFAQTTLRVLVKGDYGTCYDFYTEKLGLRPVWGDRNGPYTSFAAPGQEKACFAIFKAANMSHFAAYNTPGGTIPTDGLVGVIPSADLDGDYARLKAAGVPFIGEPQTVEDWGMRCVYFRDPEGNLFELNDSPDI